MFEALKKRGWRGAVGLITAYAFVLQAFLAYSVASQAAVRGDSSGAFSVICINDDTGARADAPGAPVQPTHCPICTLTASASLIAPDLVELPRGSLPGSVGLSYLSKRVFIFVEPVRV
jgi:hypothetical protein